MTLNGELTGKYDRVCFGCKGFDHSKTEATETWTENSLGGASGVETSRFLRRIKVQSLGGSTRPPDRIKNDREPELDTARAVTDAIREWHGEEDRRVCAYYMPVIHRSITIGYCINNNKRLLSTSGSCNNAILF
jgi:hypothetical protein